MLKKIRMAFSNFSADQEMIVCFFWNTTVHTILAESQENAWEPGSM